MEPPRMSPRRGKDKGDAAPAYSGRAVVVHEKGRSSWRVVWGEDPRKEGGEQKATPRFIPACRFGGLGIAFVESQ